MAPGCGLFLQRVPHRLRTRNMGAGAAAPHRSCSARPLSTVCRSGPLPSSILPFLLGAGDALPEKIEFAGERVDVKPIEEGDIFQLCDYELRFTYR